MPPPMNAIVETRLGHSRFDKPKMPCPLVQPPASLVPKPMNNPAPNIQATLPMGASPSALSSMPRSQVAAHPPPAIADTKPPSARPARSEEHTSELQSL